MRNLMMLLLALVLLLPCAAQAETGLYVEAVENLPEDFILGMDVSSVLALEASGVKYYDHEGNESDLFAILAANGINYIRVRVWNDPFDEQGNGYGGGNCDINTAIAIGRRATAHGMKLLVDFHYSDFWADPSKQMVPKTWEGMKIAAKADALYAYTQECLMQLRQAGVDVGMVQLGNETNGRLCGEKIWMNIYKLMNAGSRAVREVYPEALIAVHFANPESGDNYLSWAGKLDYYKLDYDVFATSYYPYWHGTLDNLKKVLGTISQTYGKKVMVAETSYAWTLEDTDFSGNSVGEGGAYEKPYPFTVQGQANEVADVIRAMHEIGGIGVFYWEGAWITAGGGSWEENHALWEKYGSGWASSYAGAYDPDDAGKYYGGSACDNQAMFDAGGHALESLKVFRLIREGNEIPLTADALDETLLTFDLKETVTLPETVNAVMSDNSRTAIPVVWEAADLAAMNQHGPAVYTVTGEAGGMEAVCRIAMVEYNYLRNYSFEEADTSMWRAENLSGTEQLYVEEKKADSLTGVMHYHFYSTRANGVEFTLEQDVQSLPAGTYRYEIAIQGGDGGETEIYSYVKINGEIRYTQPAKITSWNSWDIPVIGGIEVSQGDQVTAGVYVRCGGAGAWGKIDDARLNREK
ncbi:MAG: glycosyl hydrolase 53 family protein [Clostridia bacterium]|nr:glycosyl hydrolase 53 family protein [Clostridia bacterium]